MTTFSDRYELSRASIIVDDAPRWFRGVFFEQILNDYLVPYARTNPNYQLDSDHPIGAEWFIERLAQLMRREPGQQYLKSGHAIGELKAQLWQCEWFFFYDAIEIAAAEFLSCDREYSWQSSALLSTFRAQVNQLFVTSGIGWTLDEKGLLQRAETEERVIAEAQLRAIELHSPAKVHLAKAALMLRQRPCDSANSIKESVSAIESAGKKAYPDALTLGDVLKEIKKKAVAPPMMIAIVEKLYGFASSEPGVRHGSSADERVSRAEAEFIYVNALSTITYFEALGLL